MEVAGKETGKVGKATGLREKGMSSRLSSCLENPRDGGAWRTAIYGVAPSRTRLSDLAAAAAASLPEDRGEVEGVTTFQAGRISWRLKGAPTLCKTPSCNSCLENFSEGTPPPHH